MTEPLTTIRFAEVRTGDVLRQTRNGVTREGTADHLNNKKIPHRWATKEKDFLVYDSSEPIFLVFRKPEPKPAEPQGLGAVAKGQLEPGGQYWTVVRVPVGDWIDEEGDVWSWADFSDAKIISEGYKKND